MEFGPKMNFLMEFLSHIDADGRVIVLSDLAELGHDYKAGDMLKAYSKLKDICESWDLELFDEFKSDLYEFVDDRLKHVSESLGHNAIMLVKAITEEDDEEESEKSKKNKEKFEKEAEKRKKGEQSPIAKAARSKGETQDEMADEIDVHKSTISRYKTGTRKPSFDTMKKLSKHYGKGFVNQLLSL